jgi:hypothetical protein
MATNTGGQNSQGPDKWKPFREWLTMLAVLIGVGAGIYQWLLKEVIFPAAAPVNITTDVKVRDAGSKRAGGGAEMELQAIEVAVTARNPSNRQVYLLDDFWAATGMTIEAREIDGNAWREAMLAAVGALDTTVYTTTSVFGTESISGSKGSPR